ncbi:MAG: hypothetical protein H7X94_10365 [Vallitaleaceae bacterium]|nr:hypothetical protein [Vallitaleaceae bacterium]
MQLPDIFNQNSPVIVQKQIQELLLFNDDSKRYGLTITPQNALEIIQERNLTLRNVGRIELSMDVTKKMIETFCPSAYILQENYVSTLIELQEIFYDLKNETEDSIPDDDLIKVMYTYFEKDCEGNLDYLKSSYLDQLAQALIRKNQTDDFMQGDE